MTTYVRAPEAARQLGVSTATLYSYVSRGRVGRTLAADGRSSLFDLAELEALRARNSRPQPPPPTIDVRIASSVTQLNEDGLRFRDIPVERLVDRPYDDVCALLWQTPGVSLAPADDESAHDGSTSPGSPASPAAGSVMALIGLASRMDLSDDPAEAADQLLTAVPGQLGGGTDPGQAYAERLIRAWDPRPSPALVTAVNSTLVLLADHELATSTLAVRVAASVRASPAAAFIAGLATIDGDLHGSASHHVHRLLTDCSAIGVERVLANHRSEHARVPGFGHSIYRHTDPRFELLMDRVRHLPDPCGRLAVVTDLLARSGGYVTHLPNVDLALGALTFVAGLPPDCPFFAVARIAGFAAHYTEEVTERPLRYRGLSY